MNDDATHQQKLAAGSPLHDSCNPEPAATARIQPWIMVVIGAIAMVATLPGRTHGLGMITERLLADSRFGLDRVSYGEINLYATLFGALFCLPCGWLLDRAGLRGTVIVCLSGLTAAVFLMTHCQTKTTLSVAIMLTRGFGQSALSIVSIAMVAKWFPGRLSLPMAVYSLILSLGFAWAAQLAKPWAESDWRVVWSGIGWVLLVFLPIAALLTRDPATAMRRGDEECCGEQRSPGRDEELGERRTGSPSYSAAEGFTLLQAARTQTFWLFGLAISVVALQGAGLSLFNESVLTQQGFAKEVFYNLITVGGIAGLIAKLPVGWIGLRCPLNLMLAVGLVVQAVCLLALPQIRTLPGINTYGVLMGVAGTITTVLFFTVWGQAFGKKHLGRIQGVTQMMTVFASAAGPLIYARAFDADGNYNRVFVALSITLLMLAAWAVFVRVPDCRLSLRERSAAFAERKATN